VLRTSATRVLDTRDEDDVARLLADVRIVRNRAKVDAAITNARATVALRDSAAGGLDALVWSFAPPPRPRRPARRSRSGS